MINYSLTHLIFLITFSECSFCRGPDSLQSWNSLTFCILSLKVPITKTYLVMIPQTRNMSQLHWYWLYRGIWRKNVTTFVVFNNHFICPPFTGINRFNLLKETVQGPTYHIKYYVYKTGYPWTKHPESQNTPFMTILEGKGWLVKGPYHTLIKCPCFEAENFKPSQKRV